MAEKYFSKSPKKSKGETLLDFLGFIKELLEGRVSGDNCNRYGAVPQDY